MIINDSDNKIIRICDYCFPIEAITRYNDKDLCLDCAVLEGLI